MAAAMGLMTSCHDIDDYESIVPEQYHTILSLKESGVKDVAMSVADGSYCYELAVLKGGVATGSVTDVMVEIPSQEWVDVNYNEKQGTNYKVIPASMYSVDDYHLKIQPGQTGKSAMIRFDTGRLYEAIQKEEPGVTFVLPVTIECATHQVNPDKNVVILQCSVSPVVVGFESATKKISIPDKEQLLETGFVIEKRGDVETKVRFEVMTREYLDEHYSKVEDVNYELLSPDMYSMESDATLGADERFHTHPVTFDVEKIKNAANNSVLVLPLIMVSETSSAIVDRSETLLVCSFHEYTMRAMTDKSAWNVVYGTIAMPFGKYAYMFDGNDDGEGWMGFINDGFPGSQNMGIPYVVIDLGSKVMLGECSVQLGFNGGYWDTMPVGVEFYVSDDQEINPGLTTEERNLLNAQGNYGDPNNLSGEYIALHNRLHEFDNTIGWTKVGTISGITTEAASTGIYTVSLPQSVLSLQLRTRYVKIVAIPAAYGTTPGDRTKIHEVYFNEVTAIDGQPLD